MSKMLHVAIISHMYPHPANPMSGLFVHQQVRALQDRGVKCSVFVPTPSFPFYPKWKKYRQEEKKTVMDGVFVQYVPTRMFPAGLGFSFYSQYYLQSLQAVITAFHRTHPIDLIHCHTLFPDGHVGASLRQKLRVPVVSTVHGSDILVYPEKNRCVARHVEETLATNDAIIAVSDGLAEAVRRVDKDVMVHTIYNGFDAERFYPREGREMKIRLGLPLEQEVILFVGNLYSVKGLEYLIRAMRQVYRERPQASLWIVGEGPLRKRLQAQVEALTMTHAISFVGRRPHEEIATWMNASHLICLPSLHEGLGGVLLEAMGCAIPVVATRVGGIPEIVREGETGMLVAAQDEQALAGKVVEMLRLSGEDKCAYAQRAYRFSQSFRWEKSASQLIALYEKLT
ncbi:glycosyltransferase family 4 protein [Mechercharimyces sp. CAU 1602]|uniref:glycosyltransferase family 4 protein n=1 Tax=Mechercharimyces sp. CAU 1602 TaxID=2973933 RepID=UPI00216222BF|nr:glycosyltransferase family 4 protein [Mechercharimyces sp. CAU 1602]MCS1352256.1 glycosyltransferase family 4 protein [Mechercharimyces sp. CAU 1602]